MSTVLGGPMGLGSRAFYRTMWTLSYLAAKVLFRVRIVHKERVPADRPFVLAPIHRSYLDTPVGGMVTTRQLRFLSKESIWNSRLGGWLVTLLGGFPVERGSADRAALRAREEVLHRGESMGMFPEGTRQYGPVGEAATLATCSDSSGSTPRRSTANATARYMAPVSRYSRPNRSANAWATVVLPEPAGPSMAITDTAALPS